MFTKNKTNPVYELEKDLINERYIISKAQGNGIFETTEKVMYDAIEKIYNKALNTKGKDKKFWYATWAVVGAVIGFICGVLLISSMIKK